MNLAVYALCHLYMGYSKIIHPQKDIIRNQGIKIGGREIFFSFCFLVLLWPLGTE